MDNNGFAGRAAFANAADPEYTSVEIAGIGNVRLKTINSHQDGLRESSLLTEDGTIDIDQLPFAKARLIVQCVVDDSGARLFADSDDEEVASWRSSIVNPLHEACKKHCGIDSDGLKESAKNSEATIDGGSQSD